MFVNYLQFGVMAIEHQVKNKMHEMGFRLLVIISAPARMVYSYMICTMDSKGGNGEKNSSESQKSFFFRVFVQKKSCCVEQSRFTIRGPIEPLSRSLFRGSI